MSAVILQSVVQILTIMINTIRKNIKNEKTKKNPDVIQQNGYDF